MEFSHEIKSLSSLFKSFLCETFLFFIKDRKCLCRLTQLDLLGYFRYIYTYDVEDFRELNRQLLAYKSTFSSYEKESLDFYVRKVQGEVTLMEILVCRHKLFPIYLRQLTKQIIRRTQLCILWQKTTMRTKNFFS